MSRLPKAVTASLDRLAKLALWTSGACLVFMTIIVGMQVFSRYVLNFSLTWVEPLAIQLMGWFIFLGAAVGVRENFHLGLDLLRHFASPRANAVMDAISMIFIAIFGGFVTWYAVELANRTWDTTIPGLGISGAWDFAPLIGAGVLLTIFAVERLSCVGGRAASADPSLDTTATDVRHGGEAA
ncbi:MAG: TRAP transporter small permease [Phyllobacteriaceae bacterium]|nr:TRAP transporter small permease [Phyllobacteriaceae bacterium]